MATEIELKLYCAPDDIGRVADVNGDGRPELLVFVRAGELPPAGTVVVFEDISGNRWDLLQLAAAN